MSDLSVFQVPTKEQVLPFMSALERTRAGNAVEEWRSLVKASAVIKSWRFFLSIDPYTRWGLVKPRGYPGDATLMDFAYGHASIHPHVLSSGPIGQSIYAATSGAEQSQSARDRIELLRDEIVSLAVRHPITTISVAAGHARELETIPDSIRSKILTFTAIDLDPVSLRVAQESARSIDFAPVRRNVIKDELSAVPPADLVYSLGLFDYLTDSHATVVLNKMLALTRANGKCIVANLSPDAANLGYCEAIMDWWMVTRSDTDMSRLGKACAAVQAGAFKFEVYKKGCFNYLEFLAA